MYFQIGTMSKKYRVSRWGGIDRNRTDSSSGWGRSIQHNHGNNSCRFPYYVVRENSFKVEIYLPLLT